MKLQSPLPFSAALRVLRGQRCCRCRSSRSFAALRGQMFCRCRSPRPSVSSADKGVAVAVLRGPSRPFADKKKSQSPLPFSAALRVLRGQRCCRCRSSRSFAALRGLKEVAVAVAVLRGPPCPPWTKVLPLPFFAVLRGPSRTNVLPLPFSAALRVLRGPRCCRCRSSRSFVALRGQKEVTVAVAVLRGPPCPPWTNVLPLPFSAALRVLRGQRCCRCRSSRSFAALRGQKEVTVAVAVLRGPPCPPRTKVLPLPFFAVLRGPSWTKGSCSRRCSSPRPSVSSVDKGVAVAVLRGPSRPFVDKRKLQSPLQFSAALRVLRGPRCCRCRSSRSFVALRGQKEVTVAVAVLRGPPCPPRTNVLPLPFFVVLRGPSRPSVDKCFAVAVLRGPSRPFVDKCFAVAVLRGPPWLDQFMIPLISVQTNVNEP